MQNRHPLEQELCSLLSDDKMPKEERAIKLKKILSCFEIAQAYHDEQVKKYHEILETHGFKLFNLSTLVKPDINAHFSSYGGYTALTLALNNKDEDSALTLLNANANPNVCSQNGDFPLIHATYRNLKTSVSHLLKKGVDVNTKRKSDGNTALLNASGWGYHDIVAILLNFGADHTVIHTSTGFTALDYAIAEKHLTIIKLLLEKGAVIKNPSVMQAFLMSQDQNDEAVKYCYTKLTQYSISSTPNTSTQDKNLTITDIISRIQLKIKESRSNDKGFSSLFRDVDFSAKQIKIAEELITRLNNISTQSTSDQLKIKIASEFETALNAFTILLAEKNNINRVSTKALGSDLEKSMAGTRFHSTILALAKDISNSNITQNNGLNRGGITLFEPSSLNNASARQDNDRVSSSIGNNNL